MIKPPRSPLPAAIQTAQFFRDPERFLTRMHERYGDVFQVRFIGAPPLVYLADPGQVRELFSNDGDAGLAGEARLPYFRPTW